MSQKIGGIKRPIFKQISHVYSYMPYAQQPYKSKLPVTLIIPTWNRHTELKRLLKSLDRLIFKPQKVIVVDDKSDTELPLLSLGVKLIKLPKHKGTSYAKNIGIKKSNTKYVWFLDSDTEIINPYMLLHACSILDNYQNVGIIGGELRIGKDGSFAIPICNARFDGSTKEKYIRLDNPVFIYNDLIPTCNFLTRKSLLERINGFVDIVHKGEDSLASLMISQLGYKNITSSNFAVLHHKSTSGCYDIKTTLVNDFISKAFIYGAYRNSNIFFYYLSMLTSRAITYVHRCLYPRDYFNYENNVYRSKIQQILTILKVKAGPLLKAGREYRGHVQ